MVYMNDTTMLEELKKVALSCKDSDDWEDSMNTLISIWETRKEQEDNEMGKQYDTPQPSV